MQEFEMLNASINLAKSESSIADEMLCKYWDAVTYVGKKRCLPFEYFRYENVFNQYSQYSIENWWIYELIRHFLFSNEWNKIQNFKQRFGFGDFHKNFSTGDNTHTPDLLIFSKPAPSSQVLCR